MGKSHKNAVGILEENVSSAVCILFLGAECICRMESCKSNCFITNQKKMVAESRFTHLVHANNTIQQ